MVKHITKIRPYRVFKKDGLHFVKINKKKVYIRHATKNKLRNGDKQIVSVVVNNLLAQRKSRQRKRKNKSVLAIESTSKTANQIPGGRINGRIDPTKIPDTAGIQAPTVDPLYANANRRSQPEQIEGQPRNNNFSIADITSGLMNAYLLGKENMDFGKQVIYGKNAQPQYIPIDVSNETSMPDHPDILEVNDRGESLLPDIAPDGAAPEFDDTYLNEDEQQAQLQAQAVADRRAEVEHQKEKDRIQAEQDEDGIKALEAERKTKEDADTEEEASRAAGTAGASAATTEPEEVAEPEEPAIAEIANLTELNAENLTRKIIEHRYSEILLKEEIKRLAPAFRISSIQPKSIPAYRDKYVELLIKNPNLVPDNIQPDPRLVELRKQLYKTTAEDIRQKILPLFLTKYAPNQHNPYASKRAVDPNIPPPIFDKERYMKVAEQGMPLEYTRKLMWDVIIADQDRVQRGWGLTTDTIKQEGMTSDEIQQVLKKKTHHVIPVIASDQIATLLPLVNQKTQHFGFVINSQSEKKPGMHWKAIYFDRKKAEACYFDSLVSEPTEAVMRGIKQIMRKMADPLYFKLKINRIKFQADDSSTCGAFALRFIADMYAGRTFKVATRFTDEHISGEQSIRKYISRWGYV